MKSGLLSIILAFVLGTDFGGIVNIDKTVHDWGDVTVSDGPLSCTFTLENISSKPVTVTKVVKTCGCTSVTWPKESFAPGEKAQISAVYSNDEGAFSFDKTLNVYFEGVNRPLILHLRGDVHEKKLPLWQTYPIHFEGLGLKSGTVGVGNVLQGEQVGTEFTVANVGNSPIVLEWADMPVQLGITPRKQTIEAGATARVVVSVQSDRALWGLNEYRATPVVNGHKSEKDVVFRAVTRENFARWSAKQLEDAPVASQHALNEVESVHRGEKLVADFELKNTGRSLLRIYKMDYDSTQVEVLKSVGSVQPGGAEVFSFRVKTEDFASDSDALCVVTLYTNDPKHPIVSFYIEAIIL